MIGPKKFVCPIIEKMSTPRNLDFGTPVQDEVWVGDEGDFDDEDEPRPAKRSRIQDIRSAHDTSPPRPQQEVTSNLVSPPPVSRRVMPDEISLPPTAVIEISTEIPSMQLLPTRSGAANNSLPVFPRRNPLWFLALDGACFPVSQLYKGRMSSTTAFSTYTRTR